MPKAGKPLIFEAALPVGQAFSITGEGDAVLKLAVPEQFGKLLSENIHRMRNRSFIIRVEGLEE
jgi:hypothetical protein